jgi:toxin-antitoxin system PIN domain toxin
MMAIDTNVLVHAYREEMRKHREAREVIRKLSEGNIPWALPVTCVSEFLRVVTHRQIFSPPTSLDAALVYVEALLRIPVVRLLLPGDRFWSLFPTVARQGNVIGDDIFDAQIVATCLEHGVQTIMSEDRGMSRFQGLQVVPIPPAEPAL